MSDNVKPASPYKTLGVPKSAGKEEIRTAFKTLAKKHHPDVAGGENDTFNRIKAAYDLLMDDKARKLYDDFGVIPGDDSSMLRMQALQNITGLFMSLLAQIDMSDLKEKDVIGLLRDHINKEIQGTEKQIADIKKSEKRSKEALKLLKLKMKRKRAGRNIFIEALEENIAHIPGQIALAERKLRLLREMLEVLKDYSFDFDQPVRRSTSVMTWTTATTTGW
jgi:DnaJ-class molecular chaperone